VGAQFVTFFPAIVITTLISGFGAGFLCAVLSTAAVDFFVLEPRWSFTVSVEDAANVVDLLLFGPLAAYCVILISRMRIAIEREQAERALRASKDRMQLALDAAQLGWWQYDPHRRIVSGDTRFKEILDVATDGTPTEEIAKRVHPDDTKRYWADREAALDPADAKGCAYQYRVQRTGDEVRWVETHWLPYFEGDGRERRAAHAIGTVQDITERKEREEKERVLMEEINHRAKKADLANAHSSSMSPGAADAEQKKFGMTPKQPKTSRSKVALAARGSLGSVGTWMSGLELTTGRPSVTGADFETSILPWRQ
jgi:PAS domain S-box-containing protein